MKIISLVHTYLDSVDLEPVLTALINNRPTKYTHDIFVIENGLDESQQSKYQEKFPNITYIKSEKFIGISQGLNLGIKQALQNQPDFLWLTDPFILPEPDMLDQLFAAADRYKDCLGFTPKIFTDNSLKKISSAGYMTDWTNLIFSPRAQNEPDGQFFDRDLEIDYIPANQLFLRAKTWSEVGLFDTRYFAQFYDIDLFMKIRNRGFHLNFISSGHAVKTTGGISYPTSAVTYYYLRDKIYFSLLHAPVTTKIASLKEAFDKYFHGAPWERRAILDIFTGNLGSGSYQWE